MNMQDIESGFRPSADRKFAEATNGMISTAFPDATNAGVRILEQGGNAVDAACAAALALGVCEPQASGIGGQTMMLINTGKNVLAIDGSSRAPSLAHSSAIYRNDMSCGYRATTVPSTPATLWYVNNHYGRLPWATVVEPAIALAEDGYRISALQHRLQKRELASFSDVPSRSGARYFLDGGVPHQPGALFRQPDLAELLKIIAERGVEEFYRGKIAKQIDADMRENGGLLRYEDLALIPWPIVRTPLKGVFRNLTVYSMPPPGSGRSMLFVLMMVNMIRQRFLHKNEINKRLLLIELFRRTLFERSDRPFDPNYYPQIAAHDMLNKTYIKQTLSEVLHATNINLPIHETEDERSGETTHLSVIDGEGMAVSLTQSIERVYGSKAAAAGLGFLYNNYLMDFEYTMPSHPFFLRPNAVPWATVAPTLIFDKRSIWMALGSPGSERIFSTIVQFLLDVIDQRMSIDKAIDAPRLHCSLGGRVSLEAPRFPPELLGAIKQRNYRLDEREAYSFYLGSLHVVMKKQESAGFQGAADPRRDGTSGGC